MTSSLPWWVWQAGMAIALLRTADYRAAERAVQWQARNQH